MNYVSSDVISVSFITFFSFWLVDFISVFEQHNLLHPTLKHWKILVLAVSRKEKCVFSFLFLFANMK